LGSTLFQSKEVIGATELRGCPGLAVEVEVPGLVVMIFASEGRREAVVDAVGEVEICAGTSLAIISASSPVSLILNILRPSPENPNSSSPVCAK
jgi:hypothetical protein